VYLCPVNSYTKYYLFYLIIKYSEIFVDYRLVGSALVPSQAAATV